MGLTTEIAGRIDNNYLQVNATSNKTNTKSFRVPAQKADLFMNSYKKQEKRINILTNTAFGVSAFSGVLLTSLLTKNIKKTALKYIFNTTGGVALAIGSIVASSKYIERQQEKLLKKFGASEIPAQN